MHEIENVGYFVLAKLTEFGADSHAILTTLSNLNLDKLGRLLDTVDLAVVAIGTIMGFVGGVLIESLGDGNGDFIAAGTISGFVSGILVGLDTEEMAELFNV